MNISTKNPARTWPELLHAAVFCGYQWHNNYRGYNSFEKALVSFGRYSRGFSKEEKKEVLLRGKELYVMAEEEMKKLFHQNIKCTGKDWEEILDSNEEFRNLLSVMKERFPGFADISYRHAVRLAVFYSGFGGK